MIAQLKCGTGTPFYRLEQLERQLGIPVPVATQWEIVEEAAQVIKQAQDELIRQAARSAEPPSAIQMRDALSRNVPKLPVG